MEKEQKEQQRRQFRVRIYNFVLRLIRFLNKLPQVQVIKEIISQLMRSSTSMGANYFEAQGASSKKDYQNFFAYALKSSNETKFWLSVLIDSGLVPQNLVPEAKWLLQEAKELANIFAASILTIKGKR